MIKYIDSIIHPVKTRIEIIKKIENKLKKDEKIKEKITNLRNEYTIDSKYIIWDLSHAMYNYNIELNTAITIYEKAMFNAVRCVDGSISWWKHFQKIINSGDVYGI